MLPLLLFVAATIDLPPAARCEITRYPAIVFVGGDADDSLARAVAAEDVVVVRSTGADAATLIALAKAQRCVDPERVGLFARGEHAPIVAKSAKALGAHTVILSGFTDAKALVDFPFKSVLKDGNEDTKTLAAEIVALAHSEPEIIAESAPFLGITFSPIDVAGEPFALRLDRVLPALPAYRAGLRAGDVLLSLDGVHVASVPRRDAAARLSRRVRALVPGKDARFHVLRYQTVATKDGKETKEALAALIAADDDAEHSIAWLRVPEHKIVTVVIRRPPPPRVASKPLVRARDDDKLKQLIDSLGKGADKDDLFSRIAAGTQRADPFRLTLVDALQHDPLALRSVTREVVANVAPTPDAIDSTLRLLRVADEQTWTGAQVVLPPASQPTRVLDRFIDGLARATALQEQALRRVSAADRKTLPADLLTLALKYLDGNYVYADPDVDRLTHTIDLAASIDLRPMIAAAGILVDLARPATIAALKKELAGRTFPIDVDTPHGRIRINGPEDDDQNTDQIAVLIDLGGNDFYRCGRTGPVSLIIDLEGDDSYASSTDGAIGAAILGTSVLVDLSGDDRYTGTRVSQGAALGGVGVLVDVKGKDEYRVSQLGQAASFFGVGILHDALGDDRYEARSHAQAAAVSGGAALLVDTSGDDNYFAKGAQGSPYGTAGTYDCWCQGIGVGMRYLTSGGLGVLFDGGGKDRFEGGDFSMGSGYYYGFGIAYMRGKDNDRYVGDRYTLAASAHNGIASFVDEGGDDHYDTRGTIAALSLANDYAMTWFHDGDGNDRYPGVIACGGVSMNNGFAIFEDTKGTDSWVGAVPMSAGQSNAYHGGSSLSLVTMSPQVRQSGKTLPPIEVRDQNTAIFRLGKSLEALADDATLPTRLAAASGAIAAP